MTRSKHAGRHAGRSVRALLLVALVSSCVSSEPDKRLVNILNEQGFGTRYRESNIEEEVYATIGDSVTYEDAFNEELRATERIAIDGTIFVPEVGPVVVAGSTAGQIESLLTAKLSPYYTRNQITVRIAVTAPRYYYLLGEVGNPGPRPFHGDLTIFQVISEAAPKDNSANLNRIKVIRADPREPLVVTIPYGEMIRTGDSTYNIQIRENDIVVVPPTMLAQFGYLLSDLIFPVTEVTKTITTSFFAFSNFGNVGFGNNKFGNKNKAFNPF